MLTLDRPLIVPDCETTGVDVANDRIVELGFQVYEGSFPDGLKSEWRSLVNPGIPIPNSDVHGITDAMMVGCRVCGRLPIQHPQLGDDCTEFKPIPFFKQVAPRIAVGFSGCDFLGKNPRFDLRIIAAEMARANVAWDYSSARVVDADRLEALAVPRTLSDLYEKYTGAKLEGAHGAMADVRASAVVVAAQLEKYPDALPRDLAALHALQWPGWIDGEGKFRFGADGVPRFGNWGKHAGKRMDDPEVRRPDRNGRSYWDFVIDGAFPEDVKRLAREAKLGRYPAAK